MSKGVQVGLKDLYYAIMSEDSDVSGATVVYATPVRIAGVISAKINPNASSDFLFADDGPYETASTLGKISLELNVADLSLETQAALLGHTMEGAILRRKSTDIPPYVAVGFRSIKSNGTYRYTWLVKGKFMDGEQDNETKGDSVKFSTPTITGSFLKRTADDEWERHADEGSDSYVATIGTNWFLSPYSTSSTTAPTVASTVPAAGATAVVTTAVITVVFSKAMAAATLNVNTVLLFNQTGGTLATTTRSLDSTGMVLTITPSASLATGAVYRLILSTGVTDVYGIALATAYVTQFTVA
jgi:phi13 family phage major tail protein